MSGNRPIGRRLEALEKRVRQRQSRQQGVGEVIGGPAWIQALERLFEFLPQERHAAVKELLRPGHAYWVPTHIDHPEQGYFLLQPVEIANPGLQSLLVRIWNYSWRRPMPVPVAVVDAYLADARLKPWLICPGCGLPLPYASGFWSEADSPGQLWQGPLVPFLECPGCKSELPVPNLSGYLPHVPTPGWRFHSSTEEASAKEQTAVP